MNDLNKTNIIPESNLESGIMMIDDGTHDRYPYVKFGDKIACVPSTCHEEGLFKISLFKVEESHKINSYIDLEKYKDWENRPRIDLVFKSLDDIQEFINVLEGFKLQLKLELNYNKRKNNKL